MFGKCAVRISGLWFDQFRYMIEDLVINSQKGEPKLCTNRHGVIS